MFAEQRIDQILEMLKEDGIVHVKDLVERFSVSDVTIRKDLGKLQRQGLATKTHGGAILKQATEGNAAAETSPAAAETAAPPSDASHGSKEHLAAAAYRRLQKGDTIFLGSGVTCTMLARHIQPGDNLSVITNNLEAALILKDRCRTLILLGGEVNVYGGYAFTTNSQNSTYINTFNINKAITSCAGIDAKLGVSVSTEVNYRIMDAAIKTAHSWYLLVDRSKFNHVFPYKLADIDQVDVILSDCSDERYGNYGNIIRIE